MSASQRWTESRLAELLGTRHPVVQGPFGGGTSSVELAAAVSEAGGLGSFGANVVAPQDMKALVDDLRTRTTAPFAINLWVPLPGEREQRPSEAEYARHVARLQPYLDELGLEPPAYPARFAHDFDEQVAALLDARPPVFSFVFGVPPGDVLDACRDRGIVTVGTATTVDEALALEAAGVDAVVASGSDAGGHRGAFLRPTEESLVGTFSLVPQVVDAVSAPVIAAGGIADARGVAAALTLGADGVQIGTAFLVCAESGASAPHQAALRSPGARTTRLTRVFSGRYARAIPNRFLSEMQPYEHEVPSYPVQNWLTAAIRRASAAGSGELLNLWSGQAAGLARPRPAADFVAELVRETSGLLGTPERD